ncbi:hypothetical protein CK556_00990 [Mesoplasma chauliocola]|uniref:Nuclear transport factor 2 family protein n=1 Tax=Mesoplasma chauliocola TaxID=216427 RepID=A0A249SMU5_9MOLU|nr:hypothetical protein [Mesoplasma chauliocola]ASZ08933.1 hypothetical protein CK556_00990 [Mesoplasma chauliocola]
MEKEGILKKFYATFSENNFEKMNSLYSNKEIFNEGIFKNLNYKKVTTMLKLLLSNKKELKLEVNYKNKKGQKQLEKNNSIILLIKK